jgi:hypothetical protein
MLYFCQFVSSEVISTEEINPSFSFQVHKIIGFGPTVLQVRVLVEVIAPLLYSDVCRVVSISLKKLARLIYFF